MTVGRAKSARGRAANASLSLGPQLGWAIALSAALAFATSLSTTAAQAAKPRTLINDATNAELRHAQELFKEGDSRFDVQDYAAALERYRASLDVVASPNTQLMIARSLRELRRLDEAHAELEIAVQLAKRAARWSSAYEGTLLSAESELHALRSSVGWLLIDLGNVPKDAEVRIGERVLDTSKLDKHIVVVPGKVLLVARTKDGQEANATVHLAAGKESTVRLELGKRVTVGKPMKPEKEAPTVAPAPRPTTFVVAPPKQTGSRAPYLLLTGISGGVAVLGGVGFAVFGSAASSRFSDLQAACPNGVCPPDKQADIDSGKQSQLLANVSLGVGVVGLVAAGTFFALDLRQRSSVAVQLTPGGVTVGGRF